MEEMTYKEVKEICKTMRNNLLKRKISSLLFFVLKNRKTILIKAICLIWLFFIQPVFMKLYEADIDMQSCISIANVIAVCLLLFKKNRRKMV